MMLRISWNISSIFIQTLLTCCSKDISYILIHSTVVIPQMTGCRCCVFSVMDIEKTTSLKATQTNTTNNIQLKTYPFYMKLTTAHVFYLYHIALWETFLDIKFHWTIRYCITNTWSWTTAAKSIFYSCIRNCLFLLIVFWIYCSITVLRQVK